MDALKSWKPQMGELYKMLGNIALDLSLRKGNAPEDGSSSGRSV